MSQPANHAPQSPMPHLGICTALLAGEIPAPAADGKLPIWIKVTPRGAAQTRDGRSYSFTPETLAARFAADGVDVPADLDHSLPLKAARGEHAEVVGWAKEVQARPDGTYARMEWLEAGRAALIARTHRYVSPTFHHNAKGEATWLHSIALVAAPALANMPALAAADLSRSSVAEALGLKADADEAACLAAIGQLHANYVPLTLYNDTVAALGVATSALNTRDRKAHADKVESLRETALKDKRIMPFQRESYLALCQSEAGYQHVASLITQLPVLLGVSGLDGRTPPSDREGAETPAMLGARATRYREAQARLNHTISQSDAVTHCAENPRAGR